MSNIPEKCATCGSHCIVTDSYDYGSNNGEMVTIHRRCVTCKTTWKERFIFDDVVEYNPGS